MAKKTFDDVWDNGASTKKDFNEIWGNSYKSEATLGEIDTKSPLNNVDEPYLTEENVDTTSKVPGKDFDLGYVGERFWKGIVDTGAGLLSGAANILDNPLQSIDSVIRILPDEATKAIDEKSILDPLANAAQQAAKSMRDYAAESAYDTEKMSGTQQFAGNVAGAIGGMIPSIGVGAVAGPTAGLATMGASAFGNAMQKALDEGAEYDNALIYGIASAGVELATEKLVGGMPFLGKGTLDDVAKEWIGSKISSKTGQSIVNFIRESLGEGAEEYISEVAGEFLVDLYTDAKSEEEVVDRFLGVQDDAFYSFLLGSVTGGFMNTPGMISDIRNANKVETEKPKLTDPIMNQINEQAKAEAEQIVNQPKGESFEQTITEGLKSSDPIIRMESQNLNAKKIKQYGEKTDLSVQWDDISKTMNALGIPYTKVQDFIDGIDGALGESSPKGIKLSKKAERLSHRIAVHELFHNRVEPSGLSQTVSTELRNLAKLDGVSIDALRERINEIYSSNGKILTQAQLESEIDARIAQEYLFTEKGIKALVNSNLSLAEKISGFIRAIRIKVSGTALEKQLLKTEQLYKKAINEATKNKINGSQYLLTNKQIKKLSKNALKPDGTLKPLREQIDDYHRGYMKSGDYFVISNDTNYLSFADISADDFVISQKVFNKIVSEKHLDTMDERFLEIVFDNLDKAVLALNSKNPDHLDKRTIIFDLPSWNGSYITMSLVPDVNKPGRVIVNEITTIFGRKNLRNYLENEVNIGSEFYTNEKSSKFLSAIGQPSPKHNGNTAFINSILQSSKNNNTQLAILDNNLTEKQKSFFKNSKVVDRQGNLQPVYHASPNAEFYVFDKTKASPESDMGAGFYFSNQEVDAESNYSDETGPDIKNKIDRLAEQLEYEDGFEDADYDERYEEAKRRIVTGKTKHEVYLNIKNPVYVGNNQTELLTYDTLQEYADDNNDGEIYEGIEDDFVYNLTEDLYDILDDSGVQTVNGIVYDALLDGGIDLQKLKENLNNAYLEDSEGNLIGNEVARRLVESLGYDGIIDTTVSTKFKGMGLDPDTVHYIAFKPNQIKQITNQNPTQNDDIRYSVNSNIMEQAKDPAVRARAIMEKRIRGTFLFNAKSDPRKMYEITSRLEHEFNQTGKISAESRQELFNVAYNETLKNADITYKELPEFKQMIKEDLNRAVTQYENTLIKERELLKFAQENDIPVSEVKLNPTFGYLRDVKPEDLPDKIISYKKLKASLKSDLVGQVDNYAGGKQIDELIDQAAKEILEDGYISSTTKFKIRQEMIENGYSINDQNMRDNKELYDFIKSTKLNVPRGFGREIQDFDRTRKLLKTSTSEGRPIDQVYNELRGKFGEFFPDALTNPADQYQQIYEVMAELEPVRIMMEDSEQYNAEMRQYLEDTFTDRLEDFKNQVVYRSQKDYYDRAAKKQVAEDSALNQISEAISEKFFKDNQEIDELKKSEHVISSAASIDELAEVVAKIRDKGALSKTLAQNLDAMAGGDVVLRAKLAEIFEKPLREAKRSYVTNQKRVLDDVYKRITQDLGIKMDSKESAAMMWYGEGRRALNNVKGKVESDKLEFTPYTLDNLKQDFPETWENIVEADKIMRKYYDDYVDRINASLERIYSERNLKEQVAQRRTEIQQEIREAMERLEQYKSQRQGEVGTPDVEARINAQRKRITDLSRQFNNVAEDVYRNKRLNKRSDYYHHFQYIGMVDSIMDVLKGDSANNISNALAGISENTKPKAKWEKFMQKRSEMARYEEDAIKGFLKYAPAAEYKIAFDPYVAQMRGTIQDIIKLSDEANINNAKAINWLTNYVNSLAGKTNPLDRWVANTESGRAILQILNKVNSRVKANAVAGNLNSAVSQFYNLPNGIAVLTDKGGAKASIDLTKGAADYAAYAAKKMAKQDVSDSPINQSVFLAERFIDSTLDRFDESILHKPQQAATFLLTFGDQVVAEQLWFSAYNQGKRLGKNDPIAYADDLVARAVAGRGIGEIPLAQQSQVVKLIAPFQVEVNNAWQLMKQMGVGAIKDKDTNKAFGLLLMYAATWLMNEINQVITGNRVGMDVFNAMQDAAEGWDEEKNIVSNAFTAGGRLAGEALSNAPMGAQIAQMFVTDEYDREKLFGEADPSRYGTGNIGINAIADPITQLVTGQNIDWQSVVTNFATPYGGKQLNRLYKLAEDTGIIPRFDVNINDGIQVSQKQGAYNDKGQLKYQIDTSDPYNWAKGLAFGTYATNEGKEYIEQGYSPLSEKQTQIYESAVESGADLNYLYAAMRDLSKVGSIKDSDGETVTNSRAALAREALENAGVYDDVINAIKETGVDASSVKLNKSVIGMSAAQFKRFLAELQKYGK